MGRNWEILYIQETRREVLTMRKYLANMVLYFDKCILISGYYEACTETISIITGFLLRLQYLVLCEDHRPLPKLQKLGIINWYKSDRPVWPD